MSEIKRKYPRLQLAENGIILSWEEREEGDSPYESHYIGEKQKVFTLAKADQAMKEFIAIGKECGVVK